MQQHHNATHNAQPQGISKRHQQDNTATPVEAAPIRLEQLKATLYEDSLSDEDLIQGLQGFDRARQQGTSQQLHGDPTAPTQEDQCNALDPVTQQHSKITTQDICEYQVATAGFC